MAKRRSSTSTCVPFGLRHRPAPPPGSPWGGRPCRESSQGGGTEGRRRAASLECHSVELGESAIGAATIRRREWRSPRHWCSDDARPVPARRTERMELEGRSARSRPQRGGQRVARRRPRSAGPADRARRCCTGRRREGGRDAGRIFSYVESNTRDRHSPLHVKRSRTVLCFAVLCLLFINFTHHTHSGP